MSNALHNLLAERGILAGADADECMSWAASEIALMENQLVEALDSRNAARCDAENLKRELKERMVDRNALFDLSERLKDVAYTFAGGLDDAKAFMEAVVLVHPCPGASKWLETHGVEDYHAMVGNYIKPENPCP